MANRSQVWHWKGCAGGKSTCIGGREARSIDRDGFGGKQERQMFTCDQGALVQHAEMEQETVWVEQPGEIHLFMKSDVQLRRQKPEVASAYAWATSGSPLLTVSCPIRCACRELSIALSHPTPRSPRTDSGWETLSAARTQRHTVPWDDPPPTHHIQRQ